MSEAQDRAERLVQALQKRQAGRGYMADLRQGMNPDTEFKAWPHIARWCDLTRDRERMVHTVVMAGFAHHPHHANGGNLGVTMRRIALGEGGGKGLQSFEARFRRLLSCSTLEDVCRRVPAVIRAAAARDVTVDYAALYKDLRYWSDRDRGRRIKVAWAAGYWIGQREATPV